MVQLLILGLSVVVGFGVGASESDDVASKRTPTAAEEVLNFAMLDHKGRFYELRRADARVVVLYFTANGCPIARQSYEKLKALRKEYSDRGVEIWLVNANTADDRASIDKE